MLSQLSGMQFLILYPWNCTLHIFNLSKIHIFFSAQKFSLSSLQFNHIYFSGHLQINHIYFSVHLQTQYKKQIGLFIILKVAKKSFAMTTNIECSAAALHKPEVKLHWNVTCITWSITLHGVLCITWSMRL